jgi:SAM-dependent methyltransferase
MTTYSRRWFAGQVATALSSADMVVPLMIDLVRPASVVDVGCGLGAWLAAFVRAGVTDVIGVDGDYIDRAMLKIPAERFHARDLVAPLSLDRTFDLAVSVEVAEHLPESVADQFVASLTDLAPLVAFSAAVPGQGGNHHVNEQWPSYWAEKFAARGYAVADPFRPALWASQQVEWWYRQNLLLYVSPARLSTDPHLRGLVDQAKAWPLDIVHPEMFESVLSQAKHPARTWMQSQVVTVKQTVRRIIPVG